MNNIVLRSYKNFLNSTFRESQRKYLIKALNDFLPKEESNILDIGSGNGEFAYLIQKVMPNIKMVGIDVLERGDCFVPVKIYDGDTIPFEDNHFDYAIMINMLHHTGDPIIILKEAIRVSKKGVIIKDHYAENKFDYINLSLMEYANPNAGTLLELPLNFYSKKEWQEMFDKVGLKCEKLETKFTSYGKFWDIFFGRKMHFLGKYSVND